MKIKPLYMVLLVIFLAAFFMRIYPAYIHDNPIKYDSYYHIRVAELVKEKGTIPLEEPWPRGGREHYYPPLYHLTLAFLSAILSISIFDITRFLLPIISSLIVLSSFWLSYKFRNMTTALFVAFFMAFSPFILNASYESPEIIGLFLACFAVFFLLKEKYLFSGILIGIGLLFNTIFGIFVSIAFLIFLLYERKFKEATITLSIPFVLGLLWHFPHLSKIAILHPSEVLTFISTEISPWAWHFTPAILGIAVIPFILIKWAPKRKYKMDRYQKFWIIWVCFFLIVFLSHFITPSFYPWRMPLYLSFGFSFLLADVLFKIKYKPAITNTILTCFFIIVFVSSTFFLISSNNLRPPLDDNEYLMMDWIKTNLGENSVVLSDSVFCSNILTFADVSCLTDINFESIPDKDAWVEYESFFLGLNDSEIELFLEKYNDISHIIFASKYSERENLEQFSDKIYASWVCENNKCINDAGVYRINR